MGRPVVQPAVWAVVVAVDVAGDASSGVVEGLVLVEPDLPLFEFPKPGLDEGLGFGVAVAAAAVFNPELGEPCAEAAGGEGGAVIAPEDELAGLDPVRLGCLFDDGDRFVGAAAQLEKRASLKRVVLRQTRWIFGVAGFGICELVLVGMAPPFRGMS